jgi:sulfur-oxidizing protein SoxX
MGVHLPACDAGTRPEGKGKKLLVGIALLGISGCVATIPKGGAEPARYRVDGDTIRDSLTGTPGDPARGREIVLARDFNCLLCHAAPEGAGRPMGNLAPPLNGVGARLSEGQLRLRIVDSLRVNRETIMPSYYRTAGLNRVAADWRGKPILNAQQVEDTVAYLGTLR